RIWDARMGVPGPKLEGPEARARSVALSHDGTRLVTSSIAPPFQISRWGVHRRANGFEIEERPPPFAGHSGPSFAVRFSPDDRYVVSTGTDSQLILWNAATGQKEFSLSQPRSRDRAWAVAFHPSDGRHLAAGYSEKRVMIWDYGDPSKDPRIL